MEYSNKDCCAHARCCTGVIKFAGVNCPLNLTMLLKQSLSQAYYSLVRTLHHKANIMLAWNFS